MTLDAIEKAVGEVAANGHEDVRHVLSPAAIERVVRAVLEAVLPTLDRWEIAEDSDSFLGYREFFHKKGEYVHYDDLQAILNDGEGE